MHLYTIQHSWLLPLRDMEDRAANLFGIYNDVLVL